MSDASSPVRTAATGIVVGLAALAVVGGFAIGLPKVTDESSAAVSLPDSLPGGLRAVEIIANETTKGADSAQAAQAKQFLDRQSAIEDSAVEALREQYGVPATLRAYESDDLKAQLTITVINADAGPFLPQGPVPDPSTYGYVRGAYSLDTVGDGVCSSAWSAPVAEGQKVDPTQLPSSVYCQVARDGVTYLGIGSGLSADDAVAALDSVAGSEN